MRALAWPSLALLLGMGCSEAGDAAPGDARPVRRDESVVREAPPLPEARRPNLDGRAFPDGVLALTWDDGPDAHTLELAEYLSHARVSATFFVVNDWRPDLSSDPGRGESVYETGYRNLPILAELVQLGHRLGNHTMHHVLLLGPGTARAQTELADNQRLLDPFLTNELRLFRLPGGSWTAKAAHEMDADPYLEDLTGPVRWDVDRKDWENAVDCNSSRPALECERTPGGVLRVKPGVTARRYLASIEEARRGIVLFHDRVGDVGSRYALEVAEALVPRLEAEGYVFAAPVLAFSPLTPRTSPEAERAAVAGDGAIALADANGDGRADLCAGHAGAVACGASMEGTAVLPRFTFGSPGPAATLDGGRLLYGDLDGDRRADVCVRQHDGMACRLSAAKGFGMLQGWSASEVLGWEEVADFSDAEGWSSDAAYDETVRLGDVDGDGRADVCGRTPAGVICAKSTGAGFRRATRWLRDLGDARGWLAPGRGTTMQLGDVTGDGKADLCVRGAEGVLCAASTGSAFDRFERWSFARDFSDADTTRWASSPAYYGTLKLGDVNGDGRADLCARSSAGVVCALSNGRAFLRATLWMGAGMTDADGWTQPGRTPSLTLGDVNGDGRADLCVMKPEGVACAMAP